MKPVSIQQRNLVHFLMELLPTRVPRDAIQRLKQQDYLVRGGSPLLTFFDSLFGEYDIPENFQASCEGCMEGTGPMPNGVILTSSSNSGLRRNLKGA
jgi:hypothetical protein